MKSAELRIFKGFHDTYISVEGLSAFTSAISPPFFFFISAVSALFWIFC